MKTLAVSMILALGIAAPAFAEPPAPAPASATTETASSTTAADALIDETAILEAATPEERAKLIRRCSGPPPRPIASKVTPSSEPVAVAEKDGVKDGGG